MRLQQAGGGTRPATPWMRLGGLLLLILVPFGLWGDVLDCAAPQWLATRQGALALALVGITLLVADVLLPIPSSVVGMALCWSLGPLWGGVSMACGLMLAFVFGYALGRALPEERLRHWIGPAVWDLVRGQARHRALWWIALARPLPLLAEMTSLLAGVWRVPPGRALVTAAASSTAVSTLYAGSAWLGQREISALLASMCAVALPTVLWVGHKFVRTRLDDRTRAGSRDARQ